MTFVHDYQTLIAAVLQGVIAFFALRPVYRQLRLSQIQSAITRRELLVERLEPIERERQNAASQAHTISDEFASVIYQHDPDEGGEPEVNAEWAHHAEQHVRRIIEKFLARQESKADPQITDEPRARLIEAATSLMACLDDLHRPESTHLDDSEDGLTAEQVKAAEAKINEAYKVAVSSIGARINAVRSTGRELNDAFETAIKDLRKRIRQIDETVLKEDHAIS